MAYGVDARMEAMEASFGEAHFYCPCADAENGELSTRHDSVLPLGQVPDSSVQPTSLF